jgi:hypothetical protein
LLTGYIAHTPYCHLANDQVDILISGSEIVLDFDALGRHHASEAVGNRRDVAMLIYQKAVKNIYERRRCRLAISIMMYTSSLRFDGKTTCVDATIDALVMPVP